MTSGEDGARQILLVDPTGGLEEYLAKDLNRAGFSIRTVATAAQCLAQITKEDIEGVVTQFDLPDINWTTLLRSIRIADPLLPVLVFSLTHDAAVEVESTLMSRVVGSDADAETVVDELARLMDGEVESLQRYKHLIENSPAAINIFDGEGRSIWCNDATVQLLGLDSREEIIGREIQELVHPNDRELARAEIDTVINEKESTGPTWMKLRRDDGDVRFIRVSTATGQLFGTDIGQAIAIDETERIERERQLKVLDNWLRHNIRNRMNIIEGVAADIEAGRVDDVAASARVIQEQARTLVKQAGHEHRIVKLLELSSDQNHVSEDVGTLVTRVVEEVREKHPEADISSTVYEVFQTDVISELDVAIAELLDNAVMHNDASPPEVTVEVDDVDANHGVIRIIDNGPGIPTIEQSYLHLDKDIDQLNHASGLGLVFAYWVIRLSGGNIIITDNNPRGSIVTLKLPKA